MGAPAGGRGRVQGWRGSLEHDMRALLELETQSQHRVVSDRMSGGGDIGGGSVHVV